MEIVQHFFLHDNGKDTIRFEFIATTNESEDGGISVIFGSYDNSTAVSPNEAQRFRADYLAYLRMKAEIDHVTMIAIKTQNNIK